MRRIIIDSGGTGGVMDVVKHVKLRVKELWVLKSQTVKRIMCCLGELSLGYCELMGYVWRFKGKETLL